MSYSSAIKSEKNNLVLDYLKGLILSMMLSFGLVLIFAFSLKWIAINDSTIMPINLAIKIISVIFGSMVAVKGDSKGLVKGVIFGMVYMLVAFVSFSILASSFMFDLSFLLDVVCSAIAGGIVGIIKVNKRWVSKIDWLD